MTSAKKKIEDGATAMRQAAELAVERAKDAMLHSLEVSLPEDASPKNPQRQLGALITAATGLYADMLTTIITMHDKYGDAGNGKAEATLAVGCVKKLVAEPLMKVGEIADGIYRKKD